MVKRPGFTHPLFVSSRGAVEEDTGVATRGACDNCGMVRRLRLPARRPPLLEMR